MTQRTLDLHCISCKADLPEGRSVTLSIPDSSITGQKPQKLLDAINGFRTVRLLSKLFFDKPLAFVLLNDEHPICLSCYDAHLRAAAKLLGVDVPEYDNAQEREYESLAAGSAGSQDFQVLGRTKTL